MKIFIIKARLFLFLNFCSIIAYTQNTASDSLKKILLTTQADTNKVNLLNQLSRLNTYSATDSGVVYGKKALDLAEKINFKPGIFLAEINLSGCFTALGNFQQGLFYALNARSGAEESKDYFSIIRSNSKLNECYYYFGEYGYALNYAFEELKLVEKYYPDKVYFPWANIAKVYQGMKQADSALLYAGKAYGMNALKGSIVEAYNMVTLGDAYSIKAIYDSALFYYHLGIPIAITNNVGLDLMDLYNGIAHVEKIRNNFDSAKWYSKKSLTEIMGKNYPLGLLKAAQTLSDIYELQNQTDSSLKYLRLAVKLQDGLFNREKTIGVQNLAFNEIEKQKTVEASKLKYQNQLKIFSLLAGFVVLIIIAIVLFRNNRHRQIAYALLQGQKQETDRQKAKTEQTLLELKLTQAQLIQSEKMASLGELTAGIAHEIQNPLNFVNNFSEVNKELIGELKEEIKKGNIEEVNTIVDDIEANEEKINHHGKRADAIVKGMLQHSQTSKGQKESTDINKLADEYLRLAYHGFIAKDKSFNPTMKTNFDETIGNMNIIPQDIGRVLLNLYNNAFYAVNEKLKAESLKPRAQGKAYEPIVTVTTRRVGSPSGPSLAVTDGDRTIIMISVKDNGNGIPQKAIDKIFQPFFTTKPTGQGTGLGLSLSYDIIKAHGGEIKVETKEGEETTFIIQILEVK